jgi:hypothetical protein
MHNGESDGAMAWALTEDDEGRLEKVRRYEVTIERSYHRAIEQLRKLQNERKALERTEARNDTSRTGSVSQDPAQRAGAVIGTTYNDTPALPNADPAGFVSQQPAAPGAAPTEDYRCPSMR